MEVVQQIVSPVEEIAKRLAETWDRDGVKAAQEAFQNEAKTLRLTRGEASALAHITSCMVHGKPWKK